MPTLSNEKFSNEILIVAAEASSSLYAQRLLQVWKKQNQEIHAYGIGNAAMAQEGFEVLGRAEDLAVVGIQEVIAHWTEIKGVFDRLVSEASLRKTKVALLLDYPDFNLRLAKKLKQSGVRVVYYISPQVWAWRTGRVKLIKKVVDLMLVLFPFEKDFYQKHGVESEFVGHPLLDELDPKYFDEPYRQHQRSRFGIGPNDCVLALMPGSRRSEIKHHLQTQLETAQILRQQFPALKIALLVAPTLNMDEIKSQLGGFDGPLIVVQDDPREMIVLSDVILCASGTATLLNGLLERPMVIMYKMNRLTAWIAKRFVRSTPFFGMINLVLKREVAPEYFQEQANPQQLAKALSAFIADKNLRQQTSMALREAKNVLGQKGATDRVSNHVLQVLEAR